MKVSLINYTTDAVDLLIFTKQTRLNLSPGLLDEIRAWPAAKKMEELAYMARTIPSSWEFVDYTFLIEGVSRAFTHQFVRSRSGSYAQQSMRVTNVGDFDYIYTKRNRESEDAAYEIQHVLGWIKHAYKELIRRGQPIEDARGILPTNIATNIVAKFNLRAFSDLARSRSGGRTQSEYRDVMTAMVDAVLKVHPWAEQFLFPAGRNYFNEIEAFAAREFADNFAKRSELLKIVDGMRKETAE